MICFFLLSLTIEEKVRMFSYGIELQVYAQSERDILNSIDFLKHGLDLSFKDVARHYIGRAYFFLRDFNKSKKYFLEIENPIFPNLLSEFLIFYDFLDGKKDCYFSAKTPIGFFTKSICYVLGESLENIKDILFNLYLSSIQYPDFSRYDFRKEVEDLSLKIFETNFFNILNDDERDRIAEEYLNVGDGKEALKWATKRKTRLRALFRQRMYEDILLETSDAEEDEMILYMRIISKARLGIDYIDLATRYIISFPSEKFAGDLAMKIGVESLVYGDKETAYKFLNMAKQTPAKERAEFILWKEFGEKKPEIKSEWIKLINEFLSGRKIIKERGEKKMKFMNSPPTQRAEELFHLKHKLKIPNLSGKIALSIPLSEIEIKYLSQNGYWRHFKTENYPLCFFKEVERVGKKYDVPLSLIFSILKQESEFDPVVVSPAGAIGLAQVMGKTAQDISKKIGLEYSKDILFDYRKNLEIGIAYLKHLKNKYGKYVLAIAAYNGGEKVLGEYNKRKPHIFIENIPFRETRFYVMAVLSNWLNYSKILGEDINLEEIF